MKNGLALFLGVFATLALSWAGLLLTAHKQIGGLSQFKDPADDSLHPAALSGLASQGLLVYQDLGCVSCHTQQVRQHGFGHDLAEGGRKWGERGSYARDYIRDQTVLIGQNRIGPDLRNVGSRLGDAKPRNTPSGSTSSSMPRSPSPRAPTCRRTPSSSTSTRWLAASPRRMR